MSVLFTESFMRYARRAIAQGTELNNDLFAGGFAIRGYQGTNNVVAPASPSSSYYWFEVAADPVYASRNALTLDGNSTGSGTTATVLAMSNPAAPHTIKGVRVRLGRTNTNGSAFFILGARNLNKVAGSGSGEAIAMPSNPWQVLVRINIGTGEVSTGVSNAYVPSTYVYTINTDIYLEVEVDTVNNLVRVWVDDLLIIDTAFDPGILALAKAQYDAGWGLMLSRAHGSTSANIPTCAIRDFYNLAVDEVAPFQRLGPTTQVIGELPTGDAQAQFTRPGGYDSNAAVAALPVVPTPTDYLTGDSVGQEDRYTVADSVVATAASQVYAVGVKTQVANYAAAAHEMGATVGDGSDFETISMGSVAPGIGFTNKAAYFATNPASEEPWTPQEAADAEFGLKILS